MKVTIQDYCMMCGVCMETCPELFGTDGESSTMQVLMGHVPPKLEKSVQKAVENCGVGAISIVE